MKIIENFKSDLNPLWPLGAILVAFVFVSDRLSKWWIVDVFDLPNKISVNILPFFDLTMVWNRGISLGLFQADSDTGRYLLIALTAAVSIGLFLWMLKAENKVLTIALGLVVGGAFGNIWDRVEYGAVADFLHFYVGGYSFYVFNVADASISLGVLFMLWDALLSPQKMNTTADK
jgi:signal peptidase II